MSHRAVRPDEHAPRNPDLLPPPFRLGSAQPGPAGSHEPTRQEPPQELSVTALQPIRGTRDLIGEDQRRARHVAETARQVAAVYGFDEWTTPIFEDTSVFSRTLGETSDVVMK